MSLISGLRHRIDYKDPDGWSIIESMQLCAAIPSNNMRLHDLQLESDAITEIVESMME